MSDQIKRRGKYGRPCDLCSSRRVRCVFEDGSERCQGCINHNTECTHNRIRKKSGPKSKKSFAEVTGENNGLPYCFVSGEPVLMTPMLEKGSSTGNGPAKEHSADPYAARISLDKLISYLQIYQTWFYGYWPVLSVAEIILKITNSNLMSQSIDSITLTEKNAFHYSLACSVCAAIATQMTFVSVKDRLINDAASCLDSEYANEAKRARNLFDYTSEPSVETLLLSFFLYAHYTNCQGKTNQAIIFLREAISMSQLLGFHDPSTYEGKSAAEKHRWQKIYYTLLVTERFMCFEDAMPVILDPCIALPLLQNEEYPSLLVGFIELVKVFSVPDKHFFEEVHLKGNQRDIEAFRNYILNQDNISKMKLILDVQSRLNQPFDQSMKASDQQKLNIILSRSWIQAIAWHITFENGLLTSTSDYSVDCLAREFPVKIARDFLTATKDLPAVAFEANGPGVCVKLLEIANSLVFAMPCSYNNSLLADSLTAVFSLVNQFKNNISLPMDVYNKVAGKISSLYTHVERPLSAEPIPTATIHELFDDEEGSSQQRDTPACLGTPSLLSPLDRNASFTQFFRQASGPGSGAYPQAMVNALSGITNVQEEMNALAKNGAWSANSPLLSNFMHPP